MNERLLKYAKNMLKLTMRDFQDYPVWVETDSLNDEDEVAPLDVQVLPDEDNIYYIAADFELADGSQYEGHLRWSHGKVSTIILAKNNIDFQVISLVNEIRHSLDRTSETYSRALNRTVEETFPISYSTRIGFARQPIQGVVTH